MPTVTQSDNPLNQLKTPGYSLKDEFIPYVEEDTLKILQSSPEEDGKNVRDVKVDQKDSVKLTEYLDEKYKGRGGEKSVVMLTTNETKFKVPFTIKKGTDESSDDDGILEIKLDKVYKGVKILNTQTKFKAKYNDTLEVELEIKADKSQTFYIDFYASDDTEDEWNEGELENIHCGRFKVVYKVKNECSNWLSIKSVIPAHQFIGWGHPKIKENCYDYVVEQLRVVGHKVKSAGWRDWSKKKLTKNEGIYQLFLEVDVAGMNKGVQETQFTKGIIYLKESLKKGVPVMVGVDDDYHTFNADKTTEHFVTIVGMGEDKKGKYFLFYDNAIGSNEIGTSSKNKLYCDCENKKLEGKGDSRISYISSTKKKKYIVTQIRETK